MGFLLAGHDSQMTVVRLRSSCGVNACMHIHIFSWYAERRPMKMKAMLIIIESRKQMRNIDDAKPRVHAASCCLHEACSVYMSICIQVLMYVCLPSYGSAWLMAELYCLEKRYCSVWATSIQSKRENVCVCASEREIESRKQTRNMEDKLEQSCSLLYVVFCIVPCCSAHARLLRERALCLYVICSRYHDNPRIMNLKIWTCNWLGADYSGLQCTPQHR